LRAVDVLGIPEPQSGEILTLEGAFAAGDVQLDEHAALWGEIEDFSAGAILDALLAGLVVLVDERYSVALADAVVNTRHGDLLVAEFSALGTEVLRAGVCKEATTGIEPV
jgi:hypothetical protein